MLDYSKYKNGLSELHDKNIAIIEKKKNDAEFDALWQEIRNEYLSQNKWYKIQCIKCIPGIINTVQKTQFFTPYLLCKLFNFCYR